MTAKAWWIAFVTDCVIIVSFLVPQRNSLQLYPYFRRVLNNQLDATIVIY